MPKVYLGDVGTVITLDCGQNISAATGLAILARKPSGEIVTWTAVASGTNGLSYTTVAGAIDETGTWKLQALVTFASSVFRGETANLPVYAAFN